MRSGVERRVTQSGIATLLAVLMCLFASNVGTQNQGEAPTEAEVLDALERVRADPNLSTQRKTRTLRWAQEEQPQQEQSGVLRWLRDFFGWFAQLSRALVWVVGGLLALALVWSIARMLGKIGPVSTPKRVDAPTHVHDLDIRPESLPDDIGAAAWAAWQQGDQRGALALLYRGLLSRLVHVHRVPIRDSTTEGDCLALAAKHLSATQHGYVARLIRTWQRAIYGGHEADANDVQALCADFDTALAVSHAQTDDAGART